MSPDLGSPRLRFELDGSLAWCIVDNPERRNALSMAMYEGIGRAVAVVREDPTLEGLILTGVDDVFIVGGDIESHGPSDRAEIDVERAMRELEQGDVPVVAAVNGHCHASGVMFALLADVAVVSDRASFRIPELRRGVASPWSSTILPSYIGMARAKELVLTSRTIDATEAHAIGLVARVVPHDQLRAEAARTAYELLEAGPSARVAWKRAARAQHGPIDESAVEASYQTEEAQEGFAAFAERRPPRWSPRHDEAQRNAPAQEIPR